MSHCVRRVAFLLTRFELERRQIVRGLLLDLARPVASSPSTRLDLFSSAKEAQPKLLMFGLVASLARVLIAIVAASATAIHNAADFVKMGVG